MFAWILNYLDDLKAYLDGWTKFRAERRSERARIKTVYHWLHIEFRLGRIARLVRASDLKLEGFSDVEAYDANGNMIGIGEMLSKQFSKSGFNSRELDKALDMIPTDDLEIEMSFEKSTGVYLQIYTRRKQ